MGTPNTNLTGDITVSIAARLPKYLYPLSRSTITRMCVSGVFKTAHKKGAGEKSQWFISGAEIIEHKINNHASVKF